MSFDRQAVIHNLYISEEMSQAIGKMEPAELREDLRQEMFVVLCKMPDAMMQGLHERGELRWYMVRVMLNMVKTDRSTFHRTYRAQNIVPLESAWQEYWIGAEERGDVHDGDGVKGRMKDFAHTKPEIDTDDWTQKVNEAVGELDWYESNLLRLYSDMGHSCKPVAAATGISERGIRFAVARAKEKVKTKLRQAC